MAIVGSSAVAGTIMFMAGYNALSYYGTKTDPLISQIFVMLMAIPAFLGMFRWLGVRKASLILICFGVLSSSVEIVAVLTAFPFGAFSYSETLGFKLLGVVPWTVPIAYLPILFGSYLLAKSHIRESRIELVLFSSLLVILADLLLDPAAVRLMLWQWHDGGSYYGVPLSNYIGWFITSLVYSSLLYQLVRNNPSQDLAPLQFAGLSMLCIGGFWIGLSLAAGLAIPILAGVLFLIIVLFSLLRSTHSSWAVLNQ